MKGNMGTGIQLDLFKTAPPPPARWSGKERAMQQGEHAMQQGEHDLCACGHARSEHVDGEGPCTWTWNGDENDWDHLHCDCPGFARAVH